MKWRTRAEYLDRKPFLWGRRIGGWDRIPVALNRRKEILLRI
jgi:hypothetical protein